GLRQDPGSGMIAEELVELLGRALEVGRLPGGQGWLDRGLDRRERPRGGRFAALGPAPRGRGDEGRHEDRGRPEDRPAEGGRELGEACPERRHRTARTVSAGTHPSVPSVARTFTQWPPSKTSRFRIHNRRSIESM